MKLTFVTNFVHHHQLPLADEFYRLLGESYHYVATQALPDWLIKGGYDPSLERPYITRTYLSKEDMRMARNFIDESDVVIMGDAPSFWAKKRNAEGKVTFYCTERIYKKRIPWIKLPLHAYRYYKKYSQYKNTYLLCASAYAYSDFSLTRCFVGRAFKWGYMTKVNYKSKVEITRNKTSISGIRTFMWCARFLKWKHPELPIKLAARLKAKGYSFHIDMYGSGEEFESIKGMIQNMGVQDCVSLCGNLPNEMILREMKKHEIFLFTSDRNEGWGAVLNESMSCGCVPVACEAIGSVPYLIKDGVNGLKFKSCDIDSLEKVVCEILDNPSCIERMSTEAFYTIYNIWSPRNAAYNFIDLAQHILDNRLGEYNRCDGPASWEG